MPLNSTLEEVTAAGEALASELGCDFQLYRRSDNTHILKFKTGQVTPDKPYMSFVFSLVFDSLDDVSPKETFMHATKNTLRVGSKNILAIDTKNIDVTPAHFTTIADVEEALRSLFAGQDNVIDPKARKIPADALTTTYREISDALFKRAAMNEDMDCDGSGYMNISAYSSNDDDRDGIHIVLQCVINDDIDTTDKNNPSVTLLGAEREVNGHDWEPDSSKKLSVRQVTTLDDLIEFVEKNAKPKGKKPKA